MANRILTPDIIAKEALMQLDNELVMAGLVHRDYEEEFVKVGSTISIRKPVKYEVTDGAVMNVQDSEEGKTTITIDKRKHVAFQFTSEELTLSVEKLSERHINPAMRQLANQVDQDLHALALKVPSWVGTPGSVIDAYSDFTKAPQRLAELAVPMDNLSGVLPPADHYALAGTFSGLYINDVAKTALQRAKLPMLAGVDSYMTQNVATLTTGTRSGGTPVTNGASQTKTYTEVRDTNVQDLVCDGFTNAQTLKAGEIITVGTGTTGLMAVNPRTGARLSYLREFVLQSDATVDGSGNVTLSISPAIIVSGPYKTCDMTSANTDGLAINFKGSASTVYTQPMVFHKNAFALAMRPLEMPAAAVNGSRQTWKNLSVRVIPVWDGTNDVSKWRCDIFYGVKAIYPELATRISGT